MHYSANNFVPPSTNAIYRIKRVHIGLNCIHDLGQIVKIMHNFCLFIIIDLIYYNMTESVTFMKSKESYVSTINTFIYIRERNFV